jgi:exodeoxyribonuclease VII small subunit
MHLVSSFSPIFPTAFLTPPDHSAYDHIKKRTQETANTKTQAMNALPVSATEFRVGTLHASASPPQPPCAVPRCPHVTALTHVTTFLVLFGVVWCSLALFGPKIFFHARPKRPPSRAEVQGRWVAADPLSGRSRRPKTVDEVCCFAYVRCVANQSKDAGPAVKEAMAFEEALKKLEGIVEAMESGDLPLESLLAKYEEGSRLVKVCQTKLEEAELKIQKLEKTASGDFVLKPGEPAPMQGNNG